jgi:hypothetical protein
MGMKEGIVIGWQYLTADVPELPGLIRRAAWRRDGVHLWLVQVYQGDRWEPVSARDYPDLAELLREPDAWTVHYPTAK